MNAPENIATINAAHSVLLNAKDALSVTQVAQAIGASKPTASKQLKELAGLGLIEMEPRAGGTPFYRLIAELKAAVGDTNVVELGQEGKDIPTKTYPPAVLRALTGDLDSAAPEAIDAPSFHAADNDFSLLGVIADIRAAIGDKEGRIMLGDLAASVGEIAEERSRLRAENVALKTLNEAMPGFGAEHQEQRIDSLTKDVINTRAALTKAINEADRLRRELTGAADVADAAVGYLVRAPKRKPRHITKQENAQAAALAAVRGGASRADVLALVPVGVARRGAEWQGIQPMAKGD